MADKEMTVAEYEKKYGVKLRKRKIETPVTSPEIAYEYLTNARAHLGDVEILRIMCLDGANCLISIETITKGIANQSLVHPREVFRTAISQGAVSIVMVHNHPSGNPEPSEDDIKLTERLAQAGDIVGIDVLDHIIIGDDNYLSLKGKGLF